MAESAHDLIYRILVQYAGEAAAKKWVADAEAGKAAMTHTAAATEAATAAVSGLATAIPDLDASTKVYTISTEAEYRAVVKATEALQRRIAVRAAANLSVTEETQRLAALDAALSTESALRVAETMETKAAAAAKLTDAAATTADSTATDVNTAAKEANIFRMRKAISLIDEFSRGQRGAEVATLGSMLKGLAIGAPEMLLLMGAFAAITFGVSEVIKMFEKGGLSALSFGEDLDALAKAAADPIFLDGIQAKINILDKAKWAADEYAASENEVFRNEQSIADALKIQLTYLAALEAARGERDNAQKALALAQISQAQTEGKITPAAAISQRAQVEREYESRAYDRQWRMEDEKRQATQRALDKAKTAQIPLDAAKTAADAAAAQANAKHEQAKKDLEKFTKEKDAANWLLPFTSSVKEAQKAVDAANANIRATAIHGIYTKPSEIQQKALDDANIRLNLAQSALQKAQDARRQLEREGGAQGKQAAHEAQIKADAVDKKADANLATIKNLQAQIADFNARLSGSSPLAEAEQNRQKTINVNETTGLEKRAYEDVGKYNSSRQKGDLQQALAVIKDLEDALNGHAEVARYMATLGVTVAKVKEQEAETRRELKTALSRIQAVHTP